VLGIAHLNLNDAYQRPLLCRCFDGVISFEMNAGVIAV
jgi:hypothetical protein